MSIYSFELLRKLLQLLKQFWNSKVDLLDGYMSFRPTPFQPLQFQPITLSTVHTFNRLPFPPLANSTATNSTYLIKFKVIQFFQDVRKQVK